MEASSSGQAGGAPRPQFFSYDRIYKEDPDKSGSSLYSCLFALGSVALVAMLAPSEESPFGPVVRQGHHER